MAGFSSPPEPPAALDHGRRDLLGLTLCAPVAAVAAVCAVPAAAGPGPVAVAALPQPPAAPRGYHRTAHIDTYYASLRY